MTSFNFAGMAAIASGWGIPAEGTLFKTILRKGSGRASATSSIFPTFPIYQSRWRRFRDECGIRLKSRIVVAVGAGGRGGDAGGGSRMKGIFYL